MIIKYPNKILTKVSVDVDLKEGQRVADLLKREIASLPAFSAAGLAAPQIGINANVFSASDMIYINPKIIWYSSVMYKAKEGCLSIPGETYEVERHQAIEMEYTTYKGKKKTSKFSGFTAEVIQHEYDHLQGILINKNYE